MSVPARVALPVFATLKSVVVAAGVDEAISNTLLSGKVIPLFAETVSSAAGVAVPRPISPFAKIIILLVSALPVSV